MVTAASAPPEELLSNLSQVLWRQRSLIELLRYRLEVQQLLMSSGRDERLAFAVEEVEAAMDEIRRVEDTRLAVVSHTAVALGLPAEATLSEIRERAVSPWDYVLGEHQTALLSLVGETEELATRNRELANRGLADARSLFAAIGGEPEVSTYGPRGSRTQLALPPTLLDRDA